MDKHQKNQLFQKYLKEDLQNIKKIQFNVITKRSFYAPLAKLFLKYLLLFCAASLTVIYTLAYSGGIYLIDIHNLPRDIIIPNLAFSSAALIFLGQLYIFKSLAKGQIKSLNFIIEKIHFFEMIFFSMYVVLYAFWLQGEGTIAGTTMGASIGSFVISLLIMAVLINFESQRNAIPAISNLISEFNLQKNIHLSDFEHK